VIPLNPYLNFRSKPNTLQTLQGTAQRGAGCVANFTLAYLTIPINSHVGLTDGLTDNPNNTNIPVECSTACEEGHSHNSPVGSRWLGVTLTLTVFFGGGMRCTTASNVSSMPRPIFALARMMLEQSKPIISSISRITRSGSAPAHKNV